MENGEENMERAKLPLSHPNSFEVAIQCLNFFQSNVCGVEFAAGNDSDDSVPR